MSSAHERPDPTSSPHPSGCEAIRRRRDLRALPPRAIAEINELGDELLALGDELHVPVLGTGHPLADVFLLKHRPTQNEIQEGVAFFGRSGQALLKSLQRLGVDPLAVYGTNCLKFGTEEPDEARAWLMRELHIVQPRLVVAMGEPTGRVPRRASSSRCPTPSTRSGRASSSGSRRRSTRSSRRTSTSRSTSRRRRRVLERLQGARHLVGRASSVLSRARAAALGSLLAALCAWRCVRPLAARGAGLASTSTIVAVLLIPATFAVVWLAPALSPRRAGCSRSPSRPARSPSLLHVAGLTAAFNVTKLVAFTLVGFGFVQLFEALSWVVLVAAADPVGRHRVGLGAARPGSSSRSEPDIFETIAIAFALPGEDAAARPRPAGCPLLRAVPRNGGTIRAPRRCDVDRDDRRCSR